MNKKSTEISEFDADGDWEFISDTADCTFCGTLDYCLGLAKDWHNPAESTIERARKRCLRTGSFELKRWQVKYDKDGNCKRLERMMNNKKNNF
ncbi:hypothetical protein [Cylindrospermum sp. FACHB-282]|uniref:hypothetical protein n=1 Tax=Cylindrospermum sp. FACHB-282 TaxID=2692794 RepID=UPI001688BADA|nr:hypothetical protein [Cylindrospermum sp. FACHB-282]MBD2386025.1 hypothetical protein [Cylindrospermum sp. FACHB-282]